MKKIVVTLALWLGAFSALADTPVGPMNYQGRLLDDSGIPVTGSYNFVVRVYDAASNGVLKYQENHNSVAVDDGVYSFLVGTQTKTGGDSTWSVELWNCCAALYLEVVVNGETLTPRHRLAAAPFAFQANLALTTNNALALGGKSSTWYGSTIEAICVSGKGKWLELANGGSGACLGVGSQYPGPAMVSVATLTASTDFTDLDLRKADISGINFGNVNLSGTNFDKATLNFSGISHANLTNTVITNLANASGAVMTANLTGAKISHVNLSGVSLAGANLTGASIADLVSCPYALPANYDCVDQQSPSNGKWIVVGPNMNFSDTSLLKNRVNSTELSNPYVGIGKNFSGGNFSNNRIAGPYPLFQSAIMTGANFQGAEIYTMGFGGNLDNAAFNNSAIRNSNFYGSMVNVNFTSANLSDAIFSPMNNASLNFSYANLDNPVFMDGPTGLSLYFETSTLTNPTFASGISNLNVNESTKIFGGLYLGSQVTYAYFMETYFSGGNIAGNFTGAEFSFGEFFNVSFNGADFTGATGLGSADFVGVNWFGATCPDGYQVTTQGGTCVGHFEPL